MKEINKGMIKIPDRDNFSKKGDNGRVLIIGGSKDYIGAVALAGIAALRSGCDWVSIAAPEKVAWAINCLSPDLVTIKLQGEYFSKRHVKIITKISKNYDAILIGNGLGLRPETRAFVKGMIKHINYVNKVVDADALKILSVKDLRNSIITPHLKEMELFLENSRMKQGTLKSILNERQIVKRGILLKNLLVKINFLKNNNIVVLKGHIDTIISLNKILFNSTGNAGMTKAGTGDVLAGIAAGFLSQSKDLLQSGINSAYFNGLIGDILLKKKKGFSFLASDMADEIKSFRRKLRYDLLE